MRSQIDMANNALMRIGVTRYIESLTSDQIEAVTINRVFNSVRQRLIRRLPWPFARQTVQLALTTKELAGWRFCYRYPPEALRVFNVCGQEEQTWEWFPLASDRPAYETQLIDSVKVIATNKASASALIVRDVPDTSEMDPLFEDALTWALACEIAAPLSANLDLVKMATDQAARSYDVARTASMSERQEKSEPLPEFVRARL